MYIELCIGENSFVYLRHFRAHGTSYNRHNLALNIWCIKFSHSKQKLVYCHFLQEWEVMYGVLIMFSIVRIF